MKHSHIYKTVFIVFVFFIGFIVSCSKDDQEGVFPKLEISQEIKDLIYFKGDDDAPIVLINAQSGPDTVLSANDVEGISEIFDTTDLLVVNVHQAQTLNPNLFESEDITFAEAIDFNTQSIEMLYKVVNYFKNQGRTVYILGISFGAFITQDLIAKKGIDIADKYLIMVGRLDMDDVIWQAFSEGRFGYFENGVTPIIGEEVGENLTDRNLDKLAAGLSMNRYTQLLNPFEDLSKITYIYGKTDQAVGGLTETEVQFLQSKKVNIFAGSGDHDETINEFVVEGFSKAFGIEVR